MRLPQEFDVVCLGGGVAGEAIAGGRGGRRSPLAGLDAVKFWTNRKGVRPREVPGSLAVLGGGAVGVEIGQAFARFGSKVTIIEAGPRFLGAEEPEAGVALRPHLLADGITLLVGDPCTGVENATVGVIVTLKSGTTVHADRLLVATGRRPNFEAWQGAGLPQTDRGWLKVDPATLEARVNVYGAGDVTGLGGFTPLAYYHGQIVARRLRGEDARADHTALPTGTFTDPEVASVGLSELAARERGLNVVTASTDPAETARGYIHDFHGGALKALGDPRRRALCGAATVTPRAGEIPGEMARPLRAGSRPRTHAR